MKLLRTGILLYVYELENNDLFEVEVSIQQQQELAYQIVVPHDNEQYMLIAKTGVLLPATDVQ